MHFPQKTTGSADYIIEESFPFPALKELTVCFWEKSTGLQTSVMSIVSYSKQLADEAFVLNMKDMSGRLEITVSIDKVVYVDYM